MNQHLFLTGFMGSGKTTVGLVLSDLIGIPVVDLDALIEMGANKTINDIFKEQGESTFRHLETEVLLNVCKQEPKVITTGGGIILQEKNRQAMKEAGTVVFLYCDMKEVINRLKNDQTRPLFKGSVEEKEQLFKKRLPLYKEADFIIDTTGRDVKDIAKEIMSLIE